MAKRNSNNSENKSDNRSSTISLFLNIIIFFFAALIIYMGFSIFLKLTSGDIKEENNKIELPAEIIQAEVLNGCGVSGLADRFTDYLRDRKVDIVNVENYITFDIPNTLVIDRIGNMANAKKIAEMLGVGKAQVIQQLNDDYFLDVSIIIGKDYHKLTPIN